MTAEKFVAELFGTGTLIVLGDGVVAGVLLAKSKAQNAGWIVITFGWAIAVFCGVAVAGPDQRRPHQPRGDTRCLP